VTARPNPVTRRAWLLSAIALAGAGVGASFYGRRLWRSAYPLAPAQPSAPPLIVGQVDTMPYRRFGSTGLKVSEIGFGAWGIGGMAYGAVERQESLRALAEAEAHGCNLIDTAMIYGDSELVLGQFLRGRRDRWIIATKYSFQQQLKRLGTDNIDFYQLHYVARNQEVLNELYRLKKSGKVRYVGASVYSASDIDYVIDHAVMDGVQLPFSLLDPDPFLKRATRLRQSGLAVLVRSSLKEGFLTGKFRRDAIFPDPKDQRHSWSAEQIAATVDAAEHFRFLEAEAGTMVRAAVAYPLSYPEVSSVLLGTKNLAEAQVNFGAIPGARLSPQSLQRVLAEQDLLDAGHRRTLRALLKRALGRG
jgi:myo-inositol catabolism protein IolS